MHKCPVPGCRVQVDDARLMCFPHWSMVPVGLQRRIYTSYHKNSDGHRALCLEAIQAVVKTR